MAISFWKVSFLHIFLHPPNKREKYLFLKEGDNAVGTIVTLEFCSEMLHVGYEVMGA